MSGIDLVLRVTKFENRLKETDLVITGEGKIDAQVRFGKALSGVIQRARRMKVPVLAVVGTVEGERAQFISNDFLLDLESLVDARTSEADAMSNASSLISVKTKLLLQRNLSRT